MWTAGGGSVLTVKQSTRRDSPLASLAGSRSHSSPYVAEVSKVARRIGGKGENAGSSPASCNPKITTNVSIARAMGEAVRIAKTQLRADKELEQRFACPGDHLWEVVVANMKWRIRFDEMSMK